MFRCNGICASCRACGNVGEMDILTEFSIPSRFKCDEEVGYSAGVDIGTTTVAMAFWNLSDGSLLGQKSAVNPQRNFGGDVVSRTAFAMKSKENYDILRTSLKNTINSLIYNFFMERREHDIDRLKNITISCNRVMTSILLNEDITSISSYPFNPYTLSEREMSWDIEIKEDGEMKFIKSTRAYIVACSGGNIGGDIVAGIMSLEDFDKYENMMFLDLGTNGECVIKNGNSIYAFSAAAGPALEGGNIKNGVFAQKNAIWNVDISNDEIKLDIIEKSENERIIGLCGSGLIYTMASMVKNKFVDSSGAIMDRDYYCRLNPYSSLIDNFADDRFIICKKEENFGREISITQKDIREFQLAKAAIKSGIQISIEKSGANPRNMEMILLAGGFGKTITKEAMIDCGIFPRDLNGELKFVGNSALAGSSMISMSTNTRRKSEKMATKIRTIELSNEENFQKSFIDCMLF